MMVRMVMTTTAATGMVITVAFLEIDMFSMHFSLENETLSILRIRRICGIKPTQKNPRGCSLQT